MLAVLSKAPKNSLRHMRLVVSASGRDSKLVFFQKFGIAFQHLSWSSIVFVQVAQTPACQDIESTHFRAGKGMVLAFVPRCVLCR